MKWRSDAPRFLNGTGVTTGGVNPVDVRYTINMPTNFACQQVTRRLCAKIVEVRASVNRELESTCKAGTDAPSSGEFLTVPERREYAPCPPSNHTSSSPSGSSFVPSCPSARSTIRSVATGGASLTGWSSRSWFRFWCSAALTKGSPTSLALRARCVKKARRVDRAGALMERLREISLDAYDRLIGLELSEVAVDGCITKAQKAVGRKREEARWTGAKEGSNARRWWTLRASHLGPSPPRPKQPRLAAFGRDPRRRLRGAARALRRPSRPCLRLQGH
jgi:hypothetical protein